MSFGNGTSIRCALCAKPGRNSPTFITFPLLASAARDAGLRLRMPSSDAFHGPCGRRVFREICNLHIKREEGLS